MPRRLLALCVCALAFLPLHAWSQGEGQPRLIAQTHNSGFADGHDSFNGMGYASDGKFYYVLSCPRHDVGARMFSYDPASEAIQELGDLTEACGEKGQNTIVQGKSHVNFVEANGKLYFASHLGFYSSQDGKEIVGIPPAGWKEYPGGHFLSYDLATGAFENLALAPEKEGIITMNMDTQRGRLYGITWPRGHFIRYDLATRELKDFGLITHQGEAGDGPEFRTICRSIAVDPRDGAAYFSISDGDIFRYDHAKDAIEKVEGEDLRKDYFGLYDPSSAGHMGYNWRQTFFRPADGMIYGVHGNSGYLFRFDPQATRIEVLQRITSEPSQRSGMFDQFSYGYLGFALAPGGNTLYYLTGGPIYEAGQRVQGKASTAMGEAKGVEDLHLISYNIPKGKYADHGAIFYPNGERPLNVNSIAVGKGKVVAFLANMTEDGKKRTDLVTVKLR